MDKAQVAHLLLLFWFWVLVVFLVVKLAYLAFGEFPIERKPVERYETVLGLIMNSGFLACIVYALWS